MDINPPILANAVIIGCSILFALFPFDKRRIRASWAKYVFLAFSVLGFLVGVANLALRLHLVVLDQESVGPVNVVLVGMMGMAIGLAFTLVVSGQLTGAKRAQFGVSAQR
ncbi:MAG: hypothetical protein JWQ71_4395 [Pedosphaera sp.]|nr:hypothetical protein [Pedosphaera sp.]